MAHRQLIEASLPGPMQLPTDNPEEVRRVIQGMRTELALVGGVSWLRRYTEGEIFEVEGNQSAAIAAYREAATAIEAERRTLPTDTDRAGFAADRTGAFDRLVLLLLSRGEFAEAFRWHEQARARTMAERLSSAALHLPTDNERQLYADLTAARTISRQALAADAAPSARPAADARYDAVLARIRTEAPRLLDLVAAPPASLADLRGAMARQQFDLVYYIVEGTRLVVWHVGPKRMDVKAVLGPALRVAAPRRASARQPVVAERAV